MSVESFFLTKLPPELRLKVYNFVCDPAAKRSYKAALPLLRINRQIYHESRKIFHDRYVFVKVKTPFEQTIEHVAQRQKVPIILDHSQAPRFHGCSLTVKLEARDFDDENQYFQFIIFLDDLPRFTSQWKLADLTWDFNCRLQIVLELDAPFTPSYDTKQLSKSLQRQLLLPFGDVRRLADTRTVGQITPLSSVLKEMRALQATPYPSPEQCLRNADAAKAAGTIALQEKRFADGLKHFFEAWEAILIICEGDERLIYGDAWFDVIMTEAPYEGKDAKVERLKLRLELVAQTCLAYLKLKNYERCDFWGMRSITMVREQMGILGRSVPPQDEAVTTGFPGARDLGYVYLYTAESFMAGSKIRAAKELLLVAREYLVDERSKIDELVKECTKQLQHGGPR